MIIVKLKGGLGNQLFQYAFGRFLAVKNNAEVKFQFLLIDKGDTQREYKLDKYNTVAKIATKDEVEKMNGMITKIVKLINTKIFKRYNTGYEPSVLKATNGYMEGFWQSYKYLEPIRDTLLNEITLREPIEKKYQELLNKIENNDSVSLHGRRGDYVNDPKTKKMHNTFGLEYYENAIRIIGEKIPEPIFFVFSDDIEWVKENIKINFTTTFVSDPNMKDHEELMIMSKCKHNIIANSSFSWWGAWLNKNPNKIVIAPQKWFNNLSMSTDNLIPESWLKI